MHGTVGVATLKARLSEYLRSARAGETVVITDRGVPVARLAPLEPAGTLDDRAKALVASGLARPPERGLDSAFTTAERPHDPTGRSLESILEERAEGW